MKSICRGPTKGKYNIYDEAAFLVASPEVVEGKILSLFLAISNCLTRAYAALPKSTTALDVHHQKLLTSALIWVANTVWAAAFAVPDMLWVNGEVTYKWMLA